jgi:cell division protein FtsQ
MAEENLTAAERAKRLAALLQPEEGETSVTSAPVRPEVPVSFTTENTVTPVQPKARQSKPLAEKMTDASNQFFNVMLKRRELYVLAVLVVAALSFAYYISPLNAIKGYRVVGQEQLSKEDVLTAAGLKVGVPMWGTVRQASYLSKTAHQNDGRIKSISLRMAGMNQVEVVVKENVTVGYIQKSGQFFPLLGDGRMLNDGQKTQPSSLPVYEKFKSDASLKKTLKSIGKLPAAIRTNISEVVYSPTNENDSRLKMYMNDGNTVLISIGDIDSKMAYYPGMASEMSAAGVIDLQVGAYGTPYGQQ